MAKSADKQAPNPWIARSHFDALHTRCAEAEACVRALLNHINPKILELTAGDWKAATEAICDE